MEMLIHQPAAWSDTSKALAFSFLLPTRSFLPESAHPQRFHRLLQNAIRAASSRCAWIYTTPLCF
jgi:hypothetical protein